MMRMIVMCLALNLTGGGLFALDCSKAPEPLRLRCEETNRVGELCRGKAGDDLSVCQMINADYELLLDCDKMGGAPKQTCLTRKADVAACKDTADADREACLRARLAAHPKP